MGQFRRLWPNKVTIRYNPLGNPLVWCELNVLTWSWACFASSAPQSLHLPLSDATEALFWHVSFNVSRNVFFLNANYCRTTQNKAKKCRRPIPPLSKSSGDLTHCTIRYRISRSFSYCGRVFGRAFPKASSCSTGRDSLIIPYIIHTSDNLW